MKSHYEESLGSGILQDSTSEGLPKVSEGLKTSSTFIPPIPSLLNLPRTYVI